jgi:hypothetical protein
MGCEDEDGICLFLTKTIKVLVDETYFFTSLLFSSLLSDSD